ncbi:MAG: PIN domain-containing protein [Betaproteobacteria bacterium]|nr:PIN domain-containing protein [Betaproteobacteria bacterium]
MTALVDTNVLVYRFDPRDSTKQRIARDLMREGIERDTLRVSHQAVVEFVQAVTRPLSRNEAGLLSRPDALREAEQLLAQFRVLYPTESLLRTAVRAVATYQLSWFDAHMWAYAEHYGLDEILSEDFSDGQLIGTVRIRNPFKSS